jgi:hypothetical protein
MVMALTAGPALVDDIDHRQDFSPFDRFFFDGGFAPSEVQQEAQSGDVNQSFDVSNTGDNSNQCAGVQGVANTGNVQNQVGVSQLGNGLENLNRQGDRFFDDGFRNFFDRFGFDDFQIEDSGASIDVSPTNTTNCDQQVNQAASAFGI